MQWRCCLWSGARWHETALEHWLEHRSGYKPSSPAIWARRRVRSAVARSRETARPSRLPARVYAAAAASMYASLVRAARPGGVTAQPQRSAECRGWTGSLPSRARAPQHALPLERVLPAARQWLQSAELAVAPQNTFGSVLCGSGRTSQRRSADGGSFKLTARYFRTSRLRRRRRAASTVPYYFKIVHSIIP